MSNRKPADTARARVRPLRLYQVTSRMLPCGRLPAYSNVVKAASMPQAAKIAFDHAAEVGRPQEALWVTALHEPDDGLPGLVYETTREKCYLPHRRKAATQGKVRGA